VGGGGDIPAEEKHRAYISKKMGGEKAGETAAMGNRCVQKEGAENGVWRLACSA
jgi:hypothetical protein